MNKSEVRLYYRYDVFRGIYLLEDWLATPETGVQAMILMEPYPEGTNCPWFGMKKDRQGWTGIEEYSLFGWPVKKGTLIPDEEYFAIWELACGDS